MSIDFPRPQGLAVRRIHTKPWFFSEILTASLHSLAETIGERLRTSESLGR